MWVHWLQQQNREPLRPIKGERAVRRKRDTEEGAEQRLERKEWGKCFGKLPLIGLSGWR